MTAPVNAYRLLDVGGEEVDRSSRRAMISAGEKADELEPHRRAYGAEERLGVVNRNCARHLSAMQRFVRDFPNVVLIGGWATYIRTRVAKTHHISGRKFEVKVEGVGVDVYQVYQSKPGQRFQIPVEVLMSYTGKIDRILIS